MNCFNVQHMIYAECGMWRLKGFMWRVVALEVYICLYECMCLYACKLNTFLMGQFQMECNFCQSLNSHEK